MLQSEVMKKNLQYAVKKGYNDIAIKIEEEIEQRRLEIYGHS